jgi:phosphate transport system substrate-binding protein
MKNKALQQIKTGIQAFGLTVLFSALAASLLGGCQENTAKQSPGQTLFKAHGSNTLASHLIPALAQSWLVSQGAEDVKLDTLANKVEVVVSGNLNGQKVQIEIFGYGSNTGFDDLAWGKADLALSSKPISGEQLSRLSKLGNLNSPEGEHVIALDGLAFMVHPEQSLKAISLAQARAIYEGTLTEWSQIKGASGGSIMAIRRDDNSGTHDVFKSLVLGKSALSPNVSIANSSDELSAQIAAQTQAIGYSSLSFAGQNKVLNIVGEDGRIHTPTAFSVQTEDYPLSRRSYIYSPTKNIDPEAKQFLDYVLSEAGQKVVEEQGFVAQTLKLQRIGAPEDAPTRYKALAQNALRLSTNFRFLSNSLRLDTRSIRDLRRLQEFLQKPETQKCQVLLAGFSDSTGKGNEVAMSEQRNQVVASLIEAQTGQKVMGQLALGASLPIGNQSTATGRALNRRVEIWMRCP